MFFSVTRALGHTVCIWSEPSVKMTPPTVAVFASSAASHTSAIKMATKSRLAYAIRQGRSLRLGRRIAEPPAAGATHVGRDPSRGFRRQSNDSASTGICSPQAPSQCPRCNGAFFGSPMESKEETPAALPAIVPLGRGQSQESGSIRIRDHKNPARYPENPSLPSTLHARKSRGSEAQLAHWQKN